MTSAGNNSNVGSLTVYRMIHSLPITNFVQLLPSYKTEQMIEVALRSILSIVIINLAFSQSNHGIGDAAYYKKLLQLTV